MYDIILKKNVIDIAQVEDAEACIVALRKITKRPEEVEFLCKCLKNLTIFKKVGAEIKKMLIYQKYHKFLIIHTQ